MSAISDSSSSLTQTVAEYLTGRLKSERDMYARQAERLERSLKLHDIQAREYSLEVVRQVDAVLDRWDMMIGEDR